MAVVFVLHLQQITLCYNCVGTQSCGIYVLTFPTSAWSFLSVPFVGYVENSLFSLCISSPDCSVVQLIHFCMKILITMWKGNSKVCLRFVIIQAHLTHKLDLNCSHVSHYSSRSLPLTICFKHWPLTQGYQQLTGGCLLKSSFSSLKKIHYV